MSELMRLGIRVRVDRPPERLVAAGMLAEHAGDVAAAYGLRETRRRVRDGWAALLLERA